jgi:nicotinamide-nucleotide amidase
MLAEIITIGDEILIGQTVDTNSAWIAKQLNTRGIDIVQITSIRDEKDSIIHALNVAKSRADLILMTGGLGPTKDDITKTTLADYFNVGFRLSKSALENVRYIFSKIGRDLLKINEDQAMVPDNCKVLINKKGTAPGMYFQEDNKIIVSMPGVPYEMKYIMTHGVLPKIEPFLDDLTIVHKTITTVNVPESLISQNIEHIETNLPPYIKLAYLPHLNLVRLRLSAKSTQKSNNELLHEIEGYFDEIKEILGNVWFEGERNISEIVGELLIKNGNTIGTVESCTGGYVSHQITSAVGSSAYYLGSMLTYAYEHKVKNANVDPDVLLEKGAVSEEVAFQMAKNGKEKLGVDYCLSTTGIAGPGGATDTKPVGLVYIGLAKPNGEVEVKKCRFRGSRVQVIERTAYTALDMVRIALSE